MELLFNDSVQKIKKVQNQKRYWFIRSYGGEAFADYLKHEYVGLGLNNVPLKYISEANPNDPVSFAALQKFINNNTPHKNGEATRWANQLTSFVNEIKKGDTVIIPSKSSEKLAFGVVSDEDIFVEKNPGYIQYKGKNEYLPEKRRRVKWGEIVLREDLLGDLRGLLSSHQAITNGDDYADKIEGAQESIFIKGDQTHYVIQIGNDAEINAFDLQRFLTGLTFFYKEFCTANGIPENENLLIKIRLQSRGKSFLTGAATAGIMGLAGLFALADNPELNIEIRGAKIQAKGAGIGQSITNFLKEKQDREIQWKLFEDSINKLNAKQQPDLNLLNNQTLDEVIDKGKKNNREDDGGKAK